MSQETIDRFTKLINDFDARVKAAGSDKWDNPAPCENWKARDVVAHVANNINNVSAGLQGQQPRQIGPDEDIVSAWNTAKEGVLTALPNADLNQTIEGPMGPMPAEQLIGRLIATDVLVHTWDLARATGGDESLDQPAVEGAYSGLKPLDAMIRREGVFGPRIDSPEGADLQTQFLNFTGRRV
jgi:uncharacterized protein (TIGR03086 family)